MATNNSLPKYRVEKAFITATDSAFKFSTLEHRKDMLVSKHDETMENIGSRMSPTWIFISLFVFIAAIGLSVFGAYNAQGAIAGLVDPNAEGIIPFEILFIIGASLSIISMSLGHLIFEGLSQGLSVDEYTGQRIITSNIWTFVVGFLGGVFYISMQYYLVTSAGDTSNLNTNSLAYAICLIAILEMIVGGLILHRVFSYFLLLFSTISIRLNARGMNNQSRNSNRDYRVYLSFLDVYNDQNPTKQIPREGNMHIRKAIAYYSGLNMNLENEESKAPVPVSHRLHHSSDAVPQPLKQNKESKKAHAPNPASSEVLDEQSQNNNPSSNMNQDIQDFIDDTDENLTV